MAKSGIGILAPQLHGGILTINDLMWLTFLGKSPWHREHSKTLMNENGYENLHQKGRKITSLVIIKTNQM
jgi:hypothetical protein